MLPFVRALQGRGHLVSVVVPDAQRSWIGKAHLVGEKVVPTYYYPPKRDLRDEQRGGVAGLGNEGGAVAEKPLRSRKRRRVIDGGGKEADDDVDSEDEEWILVSSTPASCVQLALTYYFPATPRPGASSTSAEPSPPRRPPVDLVISGPNYGRNTTAVFALSSGTLGAALEAAVCGYPSVALSFAFFDRNHDPVIVRAACAHAVRVVEGLWARWEERGVPLYSVNVPLVEGVGSREVHWTRVLANKWNVGLGGCFTAVEAPEGEGEEGESEADEAELRIRDQEAVGESGGDGKVQQRRQGYKHVHFEWAPRFSDVYDSVERAGPGSDGWVVKEGMTSVTPLSANFAHVEGFEGVVELN